MTFLITLFGLILILAGVGLILRPRQIFGFLTTNLDNIWLYAGAIVSRLVMGTLLVYFAGNSKYPPVMMAIGWILVAAGVVFAAIGWNRFTRLVSWVLSVFDPYGRVAGIGSVCFGLFLIFAFL